MAPCSTGGEWPRTRRPGHAAAASDPERRGRRAACRRALGALAGLATLAVAAPCLADDQQAFELAKNPFDAGQFAEAHARLSALLDPSLPSCEANGGGRCHITDADLVERARALDAASLLALKREAEADAQIGKILRANPQYAPNPALFPQEVIDRFTMVRGALRPELEAIAQQKAREELAKRVGAQKAREAEEKWITELERLAGEERRVEPNSRWIAMVPFGVGQFQNGDVRLGIVFAASEVLLGGASLVTVAIVNKLASTDVTRTPVNLPALNSQIRTAVLVNQITFAAWAAVTVAGVVQAQVGFVPQRITTQKRPVPPRPRLTPIAAPVPGGGVFGLSGTF
ncbi:MAG: hypothetical protein QM820_10920 [Minicystis sp.]